MTNPSGLPGNMTVSTLARSMRVTNPLMDFLVLLSWSVLLTDPSHRSTGAARKQTQTLRIT